MSSQSYRDSDVPSTAANMADAITYLSRVAACAGFDNVVVELLKVRAELESISAESGVGFRAACAGEETDHLEEQMETMAFDVTESRVRYYCRKLPNLLRTGRGSIVVDDAGNEFIDFLSACGALNYGHNHPQLKQAAIDFLRRDGIAAALDFHTDAKLAFITKFRERILEPRDLRYKLQFPGPTGANCVEAAIKLARKATGRHAIVAFTNAFHGMSAGALSATADRAARHSIEPLLNGVVRLPFEGYQGSGVRELERFVSMAADSSGGIPPIAAILVETVQGEGGLNVASSSWLQALRSVADRLKALLIVDDIQAGCGRTGTFFSFERAGIVPDLVCLAKSIGGYGFPMSLLLISPSRDVWSPGEHNGTFRGNSIAFATGSAALDLWTNEFQSGVRERASRLSDWCISLERDSGGRVRRKGIGMMQGLRFVDPALAALSVDLAISSRVIVECCGPDDEVLKVLAPLNVDVDIFEIGLARLRSSVLQALVGAYEPRASDVPPDRLQGNQSFLDPHDDSTDPVLHSELSHCIS